MIVIPKRTLLLPALALGLVVTTVAPAQARETSTTGSTRPLYFSAALSGANEVGSPGDPEGSGKSLVEVNGDRVTFAFTWKGITAPTMGHIHAGPAGVSGPVKVPLFGSVMPTGTDGATGVVTVTDAALVAAITAHPSDFYLNLHTADFPAGAVRGQLGPARRGRAPLDLLKGLPFQTLMDGGQEVPEIDGKAVNDPDGNGIAMVRASGHRIRYTIAWAGIGRPETAHLHVGVKGVSGPPVVPLFTDPVPSHIYAVSGVVRTAKYQVTAVRQAPRKHYVNLHTAEFPGGAIRGQLYPAGRIGSDD